MFAPAFQQLDERGIAAPGQHVGALVGRDDVQVAVDERRIGVDDRRVGRAVDYRGVDELQLCDLLRQRVRIHAAPRCRQLLAPSREMDAGRRQHEPLAVRHADHFHVEAVRKQMLLVQLPQQRAADVADADDDEGERLARLEKRLVDDVEGAHLLRGVDDAGDVALRRALRNGADVDVVASERAEHFARHTGTALHAVADHRHDHLVGFFIERRELVLQLEPEFLADGVDRRNRIRGLHGEADRVLR